MSDKLFATRLDYELQTMTDEQFIGLFYFPQQKKRFLQIRLELPTTTALTGLTSDNKKHIFGT